MRSIFCLLGILVLVVGCGESQPEPDSSKAPEAGATPSATWAAWHAASLEFDWNGLYGLLSPSKRREADKAWAEGGEFRREAPEIAKDLGLSVEKVEGMSILDLYVARNERDIQMQRAEPGNEFKQTYEDFKAAEFLKEELDGESATVKFRIGDRNRSLRLVREEGKWYIDRSPL